MEKLEINFLLLIILAGPLSIIKTNDKTIQKNSSKLYNDQPIK